MKNKILKICYSILKKYGSNDYTVMKGGNKIFVYGDKPNKVDEDWHKCIYTILYKYKYTADRLVIDNTTVFGRNLTTRELNQLMK